MVSLLRLYVEQTLMDMTLECFFQKEQLKDGGVDLGRAHA